MSLKDKGMFTATLQSLQLQMNALLEGHGGEHASELLDQLAELSKSEQEIVLKMFSRLIQKIANGSVRLETKEDKELKDFEEGLYQEILGQIGNAARRGESPRKFQVLDGGKDMPEKDDRLIDLDHFRNLRNKAQ